MDNLGAMSGAMNDALHMLQSRGSVALPGAPAVWSRALPTLIIVLMVLVGLLMVGGLVTVVVLIAQAPESTPATVVGVLMVEAMLAGLMTFLAFVLRSRRRFTAAEVREVRMDGHGLTLRGLGPIPWADFGPAEHRMVQAAHDSGYTRRATLPLTPSGMVNVNERLTAEQKKLVGPTTGSAWNRQNRHYIAEPGVLGMRQVEVMHLINVGHQMYGSTVPGWNGSVN